MRFRTTALGGINLLLAGAVLACNPAGPAHDVDENAKSEDMHDSSGPKRLAERPAPPPPPKAKFSKDTKGLRLRRSIVVRASPDLAGEKLGTVAAHTIVDWQEEYVGEGCQPRWIHIKPRGWVCESYLEPVSKSPSGVELPKLRGDSIVPGTYAKVIGEDAQQYEGKGASFRAVAALLPGSTVRKRGELRHEGQDFWKVDGGGYVAVADLREHIPSPFIGEALSDNSRSQSFAFAISRRRPGDWVVVRDKPKGKRVRRISPRSLVTIVESLPDESAYRVGDNEWIDGADLRLVEWTEAPVGTGETERWIDVDLDRQILVAYEGQNPVYTTLVSTGTRKNPTETGIFRISIKFSETTMSGRMGESDAYSVAKVPWAQFYENDFALHTSYWHDGFGSQRSHGCINLSPRDARFLYFWSDPQLPPGWSMANASEELPGSMVRVRSSADPNPAFSGRALRVHEARARNQGMAAPTTVPL